MPIAQRFQPGQRSLTQAALGRGRQGGGPTQATNAAIEMFMADQQKAMQRFMKNQEKLAQAQAQQGQQQQSRMAQGVTGALNQVVKGMEKGQAKEERGVERREVRAEDMAASKELTLWKANLEKEQVRDTQAVVAAAGSMRDAALREAKIEEEPCAAKSDALAGRSVAAGEQVARVEGDLSSHIRSRSHLN